MLTLVPVQGSQVPASADARGIPGRPASTGVTEPAMSVPAPHDSAEIPGLEFRHRRRGDEYAEAVTGDYPGGGGMLSMSAVSPASSSRSAGRRVRSSRT